MKKPDAHNSKPLVDKHLDRFIPQNQLYRLPKWISHFLGYREHPHKEPNEIILWAWYFIGPFVGIALIEGVVKASPALQSHNPPVVIASFGAAAILSYSTIEAPLAQPRNAFFGHIISAIVGVAITKLFLLSSNFHDLQWLAGAVALGAASTVTGALNCRYPPGGAAALLAATNADIIRLGWYFVALVALGTVLMLASAFIINNIQRQYPKYWWSPSHIRSGKTSDVEQATPSEHQEAVESDQSSAKENARKIIITSERIILPPDFYLEGEEQLALEQLLQRLRLPRNMSDGPPRLSPSPSIDTEKTEGGLDKDIFRR